MSNSGVCKTKNGTLQCDIRDSNITWNEDLSLIPNIYCANKHSLNKWIIISSADLQSGDFKFSDLTVPNVNSGLAW